MKKQYRIMSRKSPSDGIIKYWVEELRKSDNWFFNRYEWESVTSERDSEEECEQYIERQIKREREAAVQKKESLDYGIKIHKVYEGHGDLDD